MRRHPRGATLLELMVALVLQAVILAVLYFSGPDSFRRIGQAKKDRAAKDAGMMYVAMWGPSEDYNGFVGDNGFSGTLPNDWIRYDPQTPNAVSGTFLWMQPNFTLFEAPNKPFVSLLGITSGWGGPYASMSFNHEALRADPWGDSWHLDEDGAIRSAGYDQLLNTADDIVTVPGPIRAGPGMIGKKGTLYIRVFDPEGRPMGSTLDIMGNTLGADTRLFVQVSNPTPGGTTAVAFSTATWDEASQTFSVTDLWTGRHVVQVTGLAGTYSGAPVPNTTAICDGSPPEEGHLETCTGLWNTSIAYVRGGAYSVINIQLLRATVPQI